jgi:hypothetical protein
MWRQGATHTGNMVGAGSRSHRTLSGFDLAGVVPKDNAGFVVSVE